MKKKQKEIVLTPDQFKHKHESDVDFFNDLPPYITKKTVKTYVFDKPNKKPKSKHEKQVEYARPSENYVDSVHKQIKSLEKYNFYITIISTVIIFVLLSLITYLAIENNKLKAKIPQGQYLLVDPRN